MKKILFFQLIFAAAIFSGCASLQKDISVSVEETSSADMIYALENRIIVHDAEFILGKEKLPEDSIASVAQIVEEIDVELKKNFLDKVVESRLLALKGRSVLLLGKTGDALKIYKKASEKYGNDIQLKILGNRLGISPLTDSKKQFENPALAAEIAINSYKKGDFDVSAGYFDSAFIISAEYEKAYSVLRAKAWEKRAVSGQADSYLWDLTEINTMQMLEIAKKNTSFMNFFAANKNPDSKKLYNSLKKQGLFESASKTEDSEGMQMKEQTSVTRQLCARFLWNIRCISNRIAPTKYSDKYRKRENAKSPVADVDIFSEDFDAVLGTVEGEIMTLIDGRSFAPEGKVSAPEFNDYMKKVSGN